ncbi:MAG: AAA family ATPase [bacterium]|nr:AAA family ATPase [bacterium]
MGARFFMSNIDKKIVILTGPPANGKSTIGGLLSEAGFCHIEADNFISSLGRQRLNDGTWSDIDREEYMTGAAQAALEASQTGQPVVISDTLTLPWMREFMTSQLAQPGITVGLVFVNRILDEKQIAQIALKRASEGHALDPDALVKFRKLFVPLDAITEPHVTLENPGDVDLNKLLVTALATIEKLWNN